MSLAGILEEIYTQNPIGRLRAEMLIIRLPVDEDWNPADLTAPNTQKTRDLVGADENARRTHFARARDRSVHLLGSHDGQHFITHNLSPYWQGDPFEIYDLVEGDVIAAVRKAEFEHILEGSRAVISLPHGAYYLAPSRRLVRSFVRVGNIQYNRDAIDAVSFWLLPYLKNAGAILTDTWSISSLAMNLSRLSAAYFGGPAPRVEMLPSYNDGSADARQNALRVVERLERDAVTGGQPKTEMLCVISATQTGSLAQHLTGMFEATDLTFTPTFVTIFRLGESTLPALYDLSGDARFQVLPAAGEGGPELRSEPIKIDPQIYFPLTFEDTAIEVDAPAISANKAFFVRYVGSGLVKLHRDHLEETGRPEHHAIYLDTTVLLNVPAFVEGVQPAVGATCRVRRGSS